nr:unnamed protein product [Spirometra erinaceieuropaei]
MGLDFPHLLTWDSSCFLLIEEEEEKKTTTRKKKKKKKKKKEEEEEEEEEEAGQTLNCRSLPVVTCECWWPDESMVSFDVVSLFTSIPQQLAIDVVRQLLADRYNERDNALKNEHLMELLRYCRKTYFTFGGQMYEQIKGTPMGSPISGLIAEVGLQRIEHLVFTKYQPKFWARYVDDTFAIVKSSDVEHLKE